MRIFPALRTSGDLVPERADGRARLNGDFVNIAILHVATYSLCVSPYSIYQLLTYFKVTESSNRLLGGLVLLRSLNSFVDPVLFMIVYRRQLRSRQRELVAVRYDARAALVAMQSPMVPRE